MSLIFDIFYDIKVGKDYLFDKSKTSSFKARTTNLVDNTVD